MSRIAQRIFLYVILLIQNTHVTYTMITPAVGHFAQGIFPQIPILNYNDLKTTIELSIMHNQDLNMPTASNLPPFYYVACNNWSDLAQLLINHKANPDVLLDNLNHTPLHIAAAHDSTEVLAVLIKAGASMDIQDTSTRTPLMYACSLGRKAHCIKLLLESGANPNETTENKNTALMCLFDLCTNRDNSEPQHKNLVNLLCYHHADPILTNSDGNDAATLAEQKGFNRLAPYIRQYPTKKQQLFDAILQNNILQFKTLMKDITVRVKDTFGNTPLHLAVRQEKLFNLILYADPHQLLERNNTNEPAFLCAIMSGVLQKYTLFTGK